MSLSINAVLGLSGLTAEVDVTITSYPDSGPYTYNIDWGDGNQSILAISSLTQSFFHTYGDSASGYVITVQVTESTSSSIVDNFNRADNSSSLGTTSDGKATWVPAVGIWGISSNTAKMFDGIGSNDQVYIDSGSSDGTIQVTLATLDNVSGARAGGPMFRWSAGNNYFFVSNQAITGACHLTRVTAGLKQTIGSSFTSAAGDVITAILSGSSITVQKNGITVSSVTDTQNQTSTKHGLYCEIAATHFDNFSFSVPLNLASNVVYLYPSWGSYGNSSTNFRSAANRRYA